MHAGLFNVLHNARDQHVLAIGKRVHVHFGRVFQEPVHQHRPVLRERDRLAHVLAHHLLVVGDHHGAAAQHVAGAHQHGVPDARGHGAGFLHAGGGAVRGAGDLEIVQQFAEQFAVFRQIDMIRIGADDRHAQPLQREREIERRLPAELHDHAIGLFGVADVEHVFERQRFEIEAVAGVVIGGHGLRVAVDHDRFHPHFAQ